MYHHWVSIAPPNEQNNHAYIMWIMSILYIYVYIYMHMHTLIYIYIHTDFSSSWSSEIIKTFFACVLKLLYIQGVYSFMNTNFWLWINDNALYTAAPCMPYILCNPMHYHSEASLCNLLLSIFANSLISVLERNVRSTSQILVLYRILEMFPYIFAARSFFFHIDRFVSRTLTTAFCDLLRQEAYIKTTSLRYFTRRNGHYMIEMRYTNTAW